MKGGNIEEKLRMIKKKDLSEVELKEEIGLRIVRKIGMNDKRMNLKSVEELDKRKRNENMDSLDKSEEGRIKVREWEDEKGN